MKQVVKKGVNESKKAKPSPKKRQIHAKRKHPQYGTSKLEEDFAKNFLDKLGVNYQYQFEARDIGRYFDFYVPSKDGSHGLLIEVDGDFWHSNPEMYDKENLRGHQKRAMRVDEYKNKWALLHGYPIMRIWESDIRKKPKEVLQRLKDQLYIQDEKIRKKGRDLGKKT